MFCVEGTVAGQFSFKLLFFCEAARFDAKRLLTPALKGRLLINIKSMWQVAQRILFWQNSRCWTWVFHLQTVHSVLNKSFLVFLWSNLQSPSINEHLCHTFEHFWELNKKCETLSSVLHPLWYQGIHSVNFTPKNQWIQLHNTAMYWGSVAGLGH